MAKIKDYSHLKGQKFGRLTILGEITKVKNKRYINLVIKCLCDCGKEVNLIPSRVISGHLKSCGCLDIQHSLSKHPLYKIWGSIKARCLNKTNQAYKDYGGRGIQICDEWRTDFRTFYDWALKNGWKQGLDVDRFPNNNGNYEPFNCRCTSTFENNRNKRANHFVSYNGDTLVITDWAKRFNIPLSTIQHRIKRGLPLWLVFVRGKYKKGQIITMIKKPELYSPG